MAARLSLKKVLAQALPHATRAEAQIALLPPGQPHRRLSLPPPLFKPGQHPQSELVICCAGPMSIVGAQQIIELQPGDAVLIPPGAWHYETYHRSRQPYVALWLLDQEAQLVCICSKFHQGSFAFTRWTTTPRQRQQPPPIDQLTRELMARPAHWHTKARALLADLLVDLYRYSIQKRQAPTRAAVDPLAQVRRSMESRFREPLSIDKLAREVGLTPNYLSHKFRATFGITFKTYLREIRLHHARLLLREGRPVKEVAWECGFHSVSYFILVFKAQDQQTPAAYARRPRGRV